MTAYLPVPPERSIINIPPDEPPALRSAFKTCDSCGGLFRPDEEGAGRILCDECAGPSEISCGQCGFPTNWDDTYGNLCRRTGCAGEGD